ncbi:MAG: TRAM domain-containing protein, partial [Ferrovum sp.]|jgi:ribosomal protein S12 methylthiotransferase|nr:TRAM domain-containing protein [Ferrovum sp.]
VGRDCQVLVDELTPEGGAVGRSAADAPEIDGIVAIAPGAGFKVGEFVTVRIEEATAHDLSGFRVGHANS